MVKCSLRFSGCKLGPITDWMWEIGDVHPALSMPPQFSHLSNGHKGKRVQDGVGQRQLGCWQHSQVVSSPSTSRAWHMGSSQNVCLSILHPYLPLLPCPFLLKFLLFFISFCLASLPITPLAAGCCSPHTLGNLGGRLQTLKLPKGLLLLQPWSLWLLPPPPDSLLASSPCFHVLLIREYVSMAG